ncbi:hypothetical protein GGF42_008375, partial [Coemansia sp. RSA 2424]
CLAFAYRPLALDAAALRWLRWDQQPAATSAQSARVDIALGPTRRSATQAASKATTSTPIALPSAVEEEETPKDEDDVDEAEALADLPEHLTEAARLAVLRSKPKFSSPPPPPPPPRNSRDGLDYTGDSLQRLFATEQAFLRDAVAAEQIFLGLVTFAYEPKVDVCDFVEDLSVAGIRFVYFSKAKGRQSKAFAERLGLETDWNTCILLSSVIDDSLDEDVAADDGYVEDHDIKAQLPRGIESIRAHLKEVDDIPLQISLFAECTPDSTREMINIFQENGDIVCCIGSALRDANTLTFAAADLAVGIEPIPHFNWIGAPPPSSSAAAAAADDVANDGSISTAGALVTQYALGAALTCIPCPLFLQHDTSLYTLMQVISEARRLVACIQQAVALLAASCLSLVLVNLVAVLCMLPPAVAGFMQMWVLWVVVPVLAAALLFVPHDESVMSTMPLKNTDHVSDMRRFAVYAVVRMLPPVVMTVLVYVTALAGMLELHLGSLSAEFGRRTDWMALSDEQQWALLAAQVFAMVAFVFHAVCVSSTLMYRTRSCAEFVPFRNLVWVFASVLCLVLTFVFAVLVLLLAFTGVGRKNVVVGRVPWYTYFIAFAAPLLLLPLQDACKLHDKKRWTRLQKLAKLEFKTKLGQHSPL